MAGTSRDTAPESSESTADEPAAATTAQFLTAGRGGVLFLQRHAGNAAVGRMLGDPRRGRPAGRMIQREYAEEGSPGKRENMDVGDNGPGVSLLQRLLGAQQTAHFDAQT